MSTFPRRLPISEMYTYSTELNPPSGPSKRYSAISSHSALTTETPTTPPRTPSPTFYPPHELPQALAVPNTRKDDRESRNLRRARSVERTRTWAEEVERQRSRNERKAGRKREERDRDLRLAERDEGPLAGRIWEVSTDVIDALVDELNPQGRFSTLPSADDVISRLNRKARRVKTDSSDSDGFGPSYADEKKIRTGMRRKDKEPKPARQATSRMEVEQAKPKSAGLSIDDIIRKHSGAVNSAVENAKENARRSTASSPILPSPPDLTPTVSPRVVKRSQCLSEEVCEDDSDADVRANLAMGQALLDKLETASITSSRTSLRYSQTPPRIHRQSLPSSRPSIDDDSHNLAVYLRSSRLNRYIHLPRPFPERPLHVSLADLGSPTGTPVVIFLGIGCVRHLIALFDDLAKALNLRLICIDRWGFGKTTNVPQEKRNPLDWAAVVERVLDELKVDTFRIIAHSAGAPYAAATALRMGERVQGKMHFLAPWISADIDGGYKWLKFVPNGVIKSAFAAEWKFQSYRLGKPPPLVHHPISSSHVTPTRPEVTRTQSENVTPDLQRSGSLARRASQMLGGKPEPPSARTPLRSNSDRVASHPSFGTDSTASSFQLKSPEQQHDPFDSFTSDLAHVLPSIPFTDKPPTDAALLQALEQASHAECEPGTTDDLLTIILNRPSRPWGFSYADLHHPATIWWGDQDERISEKSVRWMERVMPSGTELKVVVGADHNLMRSVPVMCEIFQSISSEAKDGRSGLRKV